MERDLNTVKTVARKADAYHHGDLRAALIAAAEEVIAERGVDGFSLREAARRAGVSPAAPQHHFGDARGLLTAVATQAFEDLGAALEMSETSAATRRERLDAQGAAYVAYALGAPARFDVMWRCARIDVENAAYKTAAARAFEILRAAVEDRAPREGATPEGADARVYAAWSMVHGFARLALDGAFGAGEGASKAAAEAMLPGVLKSLDV